ncbi:MAG TPA: hypothetical protein VNN72_08705, partial [Polyangiaceae bacterium]|nr:hypothetical protein [Polyangiaceae bacterium]
DQASPGGSAGTAGDASAGARPACDQVKAEAAVELENIQRCMTADDCGQVLEGTSCGCTHDLVVRTDADVHRIRELIGTNCLELGSDCDCPSADGFACVENRCTWNYVSLATSCEPVTPYTLCVVGAPVDGGVAFTEGMPLAVSIAPFGCYASNCTDSKAMYKVRAEENGDVALEGDMCVRDASAGRTCSADCGGGEIDFNVGQKLTKGTHTVRLEGDFELSVTFTVPSVVSDNPCDAMDL